MADESSAKRVIKPAETVRERAAKGGHDQPKRRVLRRTAGKLRAPLRAIAPWAKPFGVKPVRTTGRFIGLILWPRFLRNAWQELRDVTWPNRKETWKLTSAVFVFAIIFGIVIAVTDYGLDKLFRKVILK
ncbi:preprotein translocase subunit SecE [Candidatus Saccharibacteria bacterium]|nr:preprotein translocase subunit SecE [Candidatus Saccharibacteria bacterium]